MLRGYINRIGDLNPLVAPLYIKYYRKWPVVLMGIQVRFIRLTGCFITPEVPVTMVVWFTSTYTVTTYHHHYSLGGPIRNEVDSMHLYVINSCKSLSVNRYMVFDRDLLLYAVVVSIVCHLCSRYLVHKVVSSISSGVLDTTWRDICCQSANLGWIHYSSYGIGRILMSDK